MPRDAQPSARLWFIDWLRIAAFALLVLYHVGMVYVPWAFHVKASPTWPELELWMRLTNPWRMGLLFAIAGVATAVMMTRHAGRPANVAGGWLGPLARERSKRLLLPLVFGMLVIVVPQTWFEVRQRFGYDGSLLAFLGRYYTGDLFTDGSRFCDARGCLILPTWNHLWFLPYLWLYTMVAFALQRFGIGPAATPLAARTGPAGAIALLGLLALPILWLGLVRILLLPRFPETHALFDDPLAHAVYGPLFVFGLMLGRRPARFDMLAALRWPALLLAILAWALITLALDRGLRPSTVGEPARIVWMLLYATQQWCAIVAVFGFSSRLLNIDHRWRAPLNEAVFPLYLLHQTVIIVAVVMLWPAKLPVGLEAVIVIATTFAVSLAGWRLARRVPRLRPWMGLAPDPRLRTRDQPRRAARPAAPPDRRTPD